MSLPYKTSFNIGAGDPQAATPALLRKESQHKRTHVPGNAADLRKRQNEWRMYIYVQAQDGTPLMPTRRAGKVRRMLHDGQAVIISHTPFTIRLTYDTTHYTQPVSLGVDAGSKHIGLSATTEHKEL